jgi:hypothetical protein
MIRNSLHCLEGIRDALQTADAIDRNDRTE